MISGANDTFNQIMANFTIFGVMRGLDSGLGVFYNLGNLGSECVTGFLNIENVLKQYQAPLANPVILQWNIVYNFGMVYNSIKNTAYFFFYPEKNKVKTTNELGK